MKFLGFDHIDTRVSSVRAVEPFYDQLMPTLGLPRKKYSNVDKNGDWHDADAGSHNTVEYYEPFESSVAPLFIGFIEDSTVERCPTRIAFRVDGLADVRAWIEFLQQAGARCVEPSEDMAAYPAIFFEDPSGTRLELHARATPS